MYAVSHENRKRKKLEKHRSLTILGSVLFFYLFSMFNKDSCMNVCGPVSRAVAWAWVIFTTLYFLLSLAVPVIVSKAQNQAMQGSFQNGQLNGYNSAFSLMGQALTSQVKEGCKQALPLTVGSGQTIGVVNVDCLPKPQAGAPAPQPAK